jgi:hypothetical protein
MSHINAAFIFYYQRIAGLFYENRSVHGLPHLLIRPSAKTADVAWRTTVSH